MISLCPPPGAGNSECCVCSQVPFSIYTVQDPIHGLLEILSNWQAWKLPSLKCYYCKYTPHRFMDCASMLYAQMEWNILTRHKQRSAQRNEKERVSLYMPLFFLKIPCPILLNTTSYSVGRGENSWRMLGCSTWSTWCLVSYLMFLPGNIRVPRGKTEDSKACHLQFSPCHLGLQNSQEIHSVEFQCPCF